MGSAVQVPAAELISAKIYQYAYFEGHYYSSMFIWRLKKITENVQLRI